MINLDPLFDLKQYRAVVKEKKPIEIIDEMLYASPNISKISRTKRPPARFSPQLDKKPSGRCPKCKNFVRSGDDGVVCGKCEAYLHFQCAGVSQEVIDTEWNNIEFLCDEHKEKTVPVVGVCAKDEVIRTVDAEGDNGVNILNKVMSFDLKIHPYTLNVKSKLKQKLEDLNRSMLVENNDSGRQYTLKTNSLTYQLITDNMLSFGQELGGVEVKRNDVDSHGSNIQCQYAVKIDPNVTVSVTCYHTTSNLLVQLMGKTNKKQRADKITKLRTFMNGKFVDLVQKIEGSQWYPKRLHDFKVLLESELIGYSSIVGDGQGNCTGENKLLDINECDQCDVLVSSNVEEDTAVVEKNITRKGDDEVSETSESKINIGLSMNNSMNNSECNINKESNVLLQIENKEEGLSEQEQVSCSLETKHTHPQHGLESPLQVEAIGNLLGSDSVNSDMNSEAKRQENKTSPSPRKRQKKKECNDTCELTRKQQNARITTLEKDKLSLMQKVESLEKHQQSLRDTIASKNSLIESQTKMLSDNTETAKKHEKLVADLELKLATHSELGISFLEMSLDDNEEENDEPQTRGQRNEAIIKNLYEKNGALETMIKDLKGVVLKMEKEKEEIMNDKKTLITEKDVAVTKQLEELKKLQVITKQNNSLRTQMNRLEESLMDKEKQIKILHQESENKNNQIFLLNEYKEMQESKLQKAEEDRGAITDTHDCVSPESEMIPLLNSKLTEKENEILDLQETIAYNEKELQDKVKNINVLEQYKEQVQKRLQEETNARADYTSRYAETKIELQKVKGELQAVKSQLVQSRDLNMLPNLPLIETDNSMKENSARFEQKLENEEHISNEERDQGVLHVDPCILELGGEGSCPRRKCNFSHAEAACLRKNQQLKNKKLEELSGKIGWCAFEMGCKGSCPKKEEGCPYPHQPPEKLRRREKPSKICYKELKMKNSCGRDKCPFQHEFDDKLRKDETFLRRIREEKLKRAGKCVNEYRETGSCHNGVDCTFSHVISDEERNDPQLRKKMDELWAKIRARKKPLANNDSKNQQGHKWANQENQMETLVSLFIEKLQGMRKQHT